MQQTRYVQAAGVVHCTLYRQHGFDLLYPTSVKYFFIVSLIVAVYSFLTGLFYVGALPPWVLCVKARVVCLAFAP